MTDPPPHRRHHTVRTTEDILASLPQPRTIPSTQRACYIVVGKPGSGKSTLAARLSKKLNSVLVDVGKVVEDLCRDEKEVAEALSQGGTVSAERTNEIIDKMLKSEEVAFKGYTLEALPNPLPSTTPTPTPTQDLTHLTTLLTTQKYPTHTPILLHLHIPSDDLIRRRAAQLIDPVTGTIYPSAQIVFSRRRHVEMRARGGEEEGGEEEEEEEGGGEEEEEEDEGEGSESGGEEGEEGEEKEKDEEEEEGKKRKKKEKEKVGPTWEVIPLEVLERLIKRPEDSLSAVTAQLRAYDHNAPTLDALCDTHFDVLHRIDLDATQHPDTLFEDAMERIDALGYSMHCKAVSPKELTVPEGGFR
ncbi:adenylate kinase, partial [Rhizophlyctis rosea]